MRAKCAHCDTLCTVDDHGTLTDQAGKDACHGNLPHEEAGIMKTVANSEKDLLAATRRKQAKAAGYKSDAVWADKGPGEGEQCPEAESIPRVNEDGIITLVCNPETGVWEVPE